MKIHELMDIWKLADMMAQGYVRFGTHNEFPELRIFEYTQKAVIDRVWNDVTMKTRGLIVNWETKEILARPFDKFFNYGQSEQKISLYPSDTVEVHDKMDGSLGILYRRPDGLLAVATKGSFHSEQADWATTEIRRYMTTHFYEAENTWLFEIIYPKNRIVLNYDYSGLVLLGVRSIDEGDVAAPEDVISWKGRKARRFSYTTLQEALEAPDRGNAEGFVVYFPDRDVRVKIKQEDYVKLHKIVTGLTKRRVWENMSEGKSLEEMLSVIPDEWHEWLENTHADLELKFLRARSEVRNTYARIIEDLSVGATQKEFAEKAKQYPLISGMLFRIHSGGNISEDVWQRLKPRGDE